MKKIAADIIILHMCNKNHSHMRYGSWDMEQDTEFFVILDHFLSFYSSNNPENQSFEQIKEAYRYVIILHMCTKNHDYMMHASWDMECTWHNFLSFWVIFACLPHYWPQKLKFRKTGKKKPGDNILLSMCTINEDYMIYSSKFWENEKKNM